MRFPRRFQQLEERLLLAADLSISIDDDLPAATGDIVSRTIRVFNNGTNDAPQSIIRSQLTDLLEDPVWSRTNGFAQLIRQEQAALDPDNADFILSSDRPISALADIGDVNGDGFQDFGHRVYEAGQWESLIIFGGKSETTIRGSRVTSATAPPGDGSSSVRVLLPCGDYASWKPLGDVNGDGIDDVAATGFPILGGIGLSDQSAIDLADNYGLSDLTTGVVRWGTQTIGDVNHDGILDVGHSMQPADGLVSRSFVVLGAQTGVETTRFELIPEDTRFIESFVLLGDINGDSIDDFAVGPNVVFGSESFSIRFASSEPVAIREIPEDGFRIGNRESVAKFVDLNGDGTNEVLLSAINSPDTTVYWGGSHIGQDGHLNRSDLAFTVPHGIESVVPVGDINNDGFLDFAVGSSEDSAGNVISSIVFGVAPEAESVQADVLRVQLPKFATTFYTGPDALAAGDVNNDGIDDLLFSMNGGECICTATDKASLLVTGGATVVLGRESLHETRFLERDAVNTFTFRFVTQYGSQRPDAYGEDRNQDGITDIVIGVADRDYVIFGGDQLTSLDFANLETTPFNGKNGYAISMNPSVVLKDFNGDGINDRWVTTRAHRDQHTLRIYLGESETEPQYPTHQNTMLQASGDLNDQVTVRTGESVLYAVSGRLKSAANDLVATVGFDDLDLADNIFPRSEQGVSLELASIVEITDDQSRKARVELTITNDGPNDAMDVRLDESFSAKMEDLAWTVDTVESNSISKRPIDFGPRTVGVNLTPDQWETPEELGQTVGTVGDLNNDGYQDVFAGSARGVRIFWGGEHFKSNGELSGILGSTTLKISGALRNLGDVNNDGIDDVLNVPELHDARRPSIIFGHGSLAEGSETKEITEVRSAKLTDQYLSLRRAGDLNGDGRPDWSTNDAILLGNELGMMVGNDVVADRFSLGSQADKMLPTGDINGDGIHDLAVHLGATTYFLFGGPSIGELLADAQGNAARVVRGLSLTPACDECLLEETRDFNGDGFGDALLVGTQPNDWEASVLAVFGGPERNDEITVAELSLQDGFLVRKRFSDYFGTSVAVGDTDGDGVAEIATTTGSQVVILSTAGLAGMQDFVELANSSHVMQIKSDLSNPSTIPIVASGDVGQDGLADWIVGQRTGPPGASAALGEVYVVRGRPTLSQTGVGPLPNRLSVPVGVTLTVRVEGFLPMNAEQAVVQLLMSSGQHELRLDDNFVTLEFTGAATLADLNSDGLVSFADFLILSNNFGNSAASFADGDIDLNGTVDFTDFLILAERFG